MGSGSTTAGTACEAGQTCVAGRHTVVRLWTEPLILQDKAQ